MAGLRSGLSLSMVRISAATRICRSAVRQRAGARRDQQAQRHEQFIARRRVIGHRERRPARQAKPQVDRGEQEPYAPVMRRQTNCVLTCTPHPTERAECANRAASSQTVLQIICQPYCIVCPQVAANETNPGRHCGIVKFGAAYSGRCRWRPGKDPSRRADECSR